MADTLTVTIQMGEGTSSAKTFDLSGDDSAPPPPMDTGIAETDVGLDGPPPIIDGDGASGESFSASEDPPPPGAEDNTMDGDDDAEYEHIDHDGDSPPPPEV